MRRDTNIILMSHPDMGVHRSPLMRGLLGYWKLDEYAGTRYDSHVRGYNLAITGSVNYNIGKMGNCAQFVTGAENKLGTAAHASLQEVNWANGFTVAGWIYIPTAWAAGSAIITKAGSVNDWSLYFSALNDARFTIYDSTTGDSIGRITTMQSVDEWYFMAGRYNPITKKAELQLNDSAWAVGSALSNSPRNVCNVLDINKIGASIGTCLLDSISLWARYLTNEEVSSIYNSGNGLEYPFDGTLPIEATEVHVGTDWYVAVT